MKRSIDDLGVCVLELRRLKPRRHQHNRSLAGHNGNAADQVLQNTQRETALLSALFQTASRRAFGHLPGSSHLLSVATECAIQSFERRGLHSLPILLVYDEVCHVVTHVRTWVGHAASRDRTRPKREQGVLQL